MGKKNGLISFYLKNTIDPIIKKEVSTFSYVCGVYVFEHLSEHVVMSSKTLSNIPVAEVNDKIVYRNKNLSIRIVAILNSCISLF
jgi:hypothetical protein